MANEVTRTAPTHWTNGGIGITNFDKQERPQYEKAIKKYGKDYLVISDVPMLPMTEATDNALCFFPGKPEAVDLSEFWKIFKATP